VLFVTIHHSPHHPDLHSFPTRRSSDLKTVATYFGRENNSVVTRKANGEFIDPRVEIVYDDARHYILTTKEKFDIITSRGSINSRSEEHTSELQSLRHLVCRLLLEKKNK